MPRRTSSHAALGALTPRQTASLYGRPLAARRTGPLYSAFPYPTKIDPEAVALYVAAHTRPGDTVFDGFAGSGTTGLAAALCEDPPSTLRLEAKRRGLPVKWGPRNAILYELGYLGAFVSRTLNNPPDPTRFQSAATELLRDVGSDFGWLYSAKDPDGRRGAIRHVVWSDSLRCPTCGHVATLWEACVSLDPASVSPLFRCPLCFAEHRTGTLERVCESTHDDLTGSPQERRRRSVARVYGATHQQNWRRPPTEDDLAVLARIEREPIPACVPKLRINWGDLHRRGYHHGVSHLHHFYSRRNLIAFSRLWEQSDSIDAALRDAIRFWLLSYNASHTTMMTRVVAKSGQRDLVVTSAQSGVLYISGLPVEKNVFRGLDRKLSTVTKAFQSIHDRNARVTVHQRSSCAVDLPDASIDYVFTDPPFGANIPYSEIALLNEGWLGKRTDTTEEVVVSPSQRKTIDDYQALLTTALGEVRRILKPSSCATVVFHSAAAGVWNALRNAYTDAGLYVDHAGILDKKQASFKQVTTTGAVRGDPVLLLRRRQHAPAHMNEDPWEVAAKIKHESSDLELSEQTPARLYSRLVTHYLSNHQDVPIDARQFYTWLASQEAVEVDRAQ